MVVGDWTFPAIPIVLDSDVPVGSTAPSLNYANSLAARAIAYPTAGTINGSDIRGLDSGVIETWIKSLTRNAGNTPTGIFCRCTNTTIATFTGYSVRLFFNTTQDNVRIYRHSSSSTGTQLGINYPTSSVLAANTWYHLKFTWTVAGSNLVLQVAVDFGSGYVDQISGGGYVDTTPLSTGSPTQTCGLFFENVGTTFKTDDFKVYSQ